ncbi:MAG: hypothetical protein QG650_521 [Patescibacteria group bacterium]|nr:hypothetical protein [Patescibacteria group bacterium]
MFPRNHVRAGQCRKRLETHALRREFGLDGSRVGFESVHSEGSLPIGGKSREDETEIRFGKKCGKAVEKFGRKGFRHAKKNDGRKKELFGKTTQQDILDSVQK